MLVSGAHFNPAVTVGLLVGRRISPMDAVAYVLAQLAGGVVGAIVATLAAPGVSLAAGTPALATGVSVGQGILLEAILTFFLVVVVYGTGVDQRFAGRVGGLAIGLTITLDILAGGPLTGAAMNPARWLAPAAVDMNWKNGLVYLVGPLAGGALAGLLCSTLFQPKEPAAA
jgi:aquaporin Z